ncbi:MAG: Tm-1-like ATP-binding domain-containing protein, partial [Tissierellaceae bacterium]
YATEILSKAMEKIVPRLYEEGKFDGIISFGGTGGTSIVTPGMRALPIGVPKIMVSTVASGNTSFYIGASDLIMMPSVVDVAGLNRISIEIFTNAAHAMAGMLNYDSEKYVSDKPLIAATMFGLTTPAVNFAREYLEARGYEVLIFHATGTGGKSMESLINEGYIEGVLDFTTTEWCDELFGGVLNAGPNRLEAAALNGIPQVVSLGALDMVNFGAFDTVPAKYAGRNFYKHNPSVTLMRTNVEENRILGEKIAEKLNLAKENTVLMIPKKGISGIDVEGQHFYGPEEDKALFETLKAKVNTDVVEIIEMDTVINDQVFAETAAQKLIDMIEAKNK